MNKRVIIYWLIAFLVMILISFALANQVETGIIQPIIRYIWIIRGNLQSINGTFYWVCLLLVVILIAYLSLRSGEMRIRRRRRVVEKFPGEVSQLAFWIKRIRSGVYARWYIARTLSDLALEITSGKNASEDPGDILRNMGSPRSDAILTYLLTARRTTPATFSRQLEAAGLTDDPTVETIVDHLERYLENPNDT
jgi:hypothetical protein